MHFEDNLKRHEQNKEYQNLWKLREVFNSFNKAYDDFCSSSSHVVVGKAIVIFDGEVIFRQYIPSKKGSILASKFIYCVTLQVILMT